VEVVVVEGEGIIGWKGGDGVIAIGEREGLVGDGEGEEGGGEGEERAEREG